MSCTVSRDNKSILSVLWGKLLKLFHIGIFSLGNFPKGTFTISQLGHLSIFFEQKKWMEMSYKIFCYRGRIKIPTHVLHWGRIRVLFWILPPTHFLQNLKKTFYIYFFDQYNKLTRFCIDIVLNLKTLVLAPP